MLVVMMPFTTGIKLCLFNRADASVDPEDCDLPEIELILETSLA